MTKPNMKRIIGHWTGGADTASAEDKAHYHRLVEADCSVVYGTEEIADNIVTSDGDYAAHTLNLNTASIGVACCGMARAQENPFNAGFYPINEKQFKTFCHIIADLCDEHQIPCTPSTVLTHAEVQHTLGVRQRGKWDFTRLDFKPELIGAKAVGDYMREIVSAALGYGEPVKTPVRRPMLSFGDKGVAVAELQTDMAALGYFSGRKDGDFGSLTRAALLAFQADNGLTTDAIAGSATWAALASAQPRPLRNISQQDIDETSGTAKDAMMTSRVADAVGAGGLLGVAAQARGAGEAVDAASGILSRVSDLVVAQWPGLLVCALCLLAWFALRSLGYTTRKRRLRDAQEHRSLAR